jgi:hypothetical protein
MPAALRAGLYDSIEGATTAPHPAGAVATHTGELRVSRGPGPASEDKVPGNGPNQVLLTQIEAPLFHTEHIVVKERGRRGGDGTIGRDQLPLAGTKSLGARLTGLIVRCDRKMMLATGTGT